MSTLSMPPAEGVQGLPGGLSDKLASWTPALVQTVLASAGLAVLLSWAVLAFVHARDRYQTDFVSGVYASLAARLNEGVLYPEPFDGSHYAGTRYMPLHLVLHAGLARLSGEYLLSGKVLTCSLGLILFAQLFVLLRRLGCGWGLALALPALVAVSEPGLLALTTIRGDLLPVVLQVAALMLLAPPALPGRVRSALAGLLCALAVLAKLSAGWAALAALLMLTRGRHWRCLAVFLAAWLLPLLAALLALHLASSGRMLDNFTVFSAAGIRRTGFLRGPFVFVYHLVHGGRAVGLLVPLVVIEVLLAVRARRLTIYHLALLACVPVLLVIFTDVGADYNHVLDLVVLAIPVLGCLWTSLPAERGLGSLRLALALGLSWGLFACWVAILDQPVRAALLGGPRWAAARYPAKPLAALVPDEARILSDDPWVELSRGQTPVVLDAFAVARMAESRPGTVDPLLARIEREEFGYLVLRNRMDWSGGSGPPREKSSFWLTWEELLFGPRLVAALRKHYRLHAEADGYFVYVPCGAGAR
jgi:hypothetical protein